MTLAEANGKHASFLDGITSIREALSLLPILDQMTDADEATTAEEVRKFKAEREKPKRPIPETAAAKAEREAVRLEVVERPAPAPEPVRLEVVQRVPQAPREATIIEVVTAKVDADEVAALKAENEQLRAELAGETLDSKARELMGALEKTSLVNFVESLIDAFRFSIEENNELRAALAAASLPDSDEPTPTRKAKGKKVSIPKKPTPSEGVMSAAEFLGAA